MWLAERGWRVTGVDFSDVALAKAAELAASRGVEVEWVVADVLEHEPEPRAFDLVALLYLQLPRDELLRAVRSAARAVAPGGTLVVLGHDTTNLAHGHGGPKDASVLYTAEDVVPALGGLVVSARRRSSGRCRSSRARPSRSTRSFARTGPTDGSRRRR